MLLFAGKTFSISLYSSLQYGHHVVMKYSTTGFPERLLRLRFCPSVAVSAKSGALSPIELPTGCSPVGCTSPGRLSAVYLAVDVQPLIRTTRIKTGINLFIISTITQFVIQWHGIDIKITS